MAESLLYRPAEIGPAVGAGFPFVVLHQLTLCRDLSVHRRPWPIRVHEHTHTPVLDLKPSLEGWKDRWTGIAPDFSLSAEVADCIVFPWSQV